MSHSQQTSSSISDSDGGQNSNSNITTQTMQKNNSYSSMLTYNSDTVMSPFSDMSSSMETTGYFSFRSIGLHEPVYLDGEEEEEDEEEDDVVKDIKSKATLPTSTRRSSTSPAGKRTARNDNGDNSKKVKLSNRDRSGSLSRLFGILSPSNPSSAPSSPSSFMLPQRSSSFTSLFSLPRAIVGHPGHVTCNQAPMIWDKNNFKFPRLQLQRSYTTTDLINDNVMPTRPKLLTSMKIKSDPCIDVDWSIYVDPYNLYSRRRCSEGFLVNAESSLRDVLW